MRTIALISFILLQQATTLMAQSSFVEIGQAAGIDHFQRSTLDLGGGVAVFDLNNDGWEDIYLTGGQNRDKLYRNNGDGTFDEIGVEAGIGITAAMITYGVTTGDIDNDGFRDILVVTEMDEEALLFRNNGNSTFSRVVGAFDVSTSQRGISATFGDVNKDGFLDIYITNYVHVPEVVYGEQFEVIGFAHQCYPDLLLINNGDLTFTESSALYGLNQAGCGLATTFTDFDGDGNMDLFVVNDFGEWVSPNLLYRNLYPNPTLEDVSAQLGVNAEMYGMGIAVGDYDRDGDLDYYNTNIGPNYLFRNDSSHFTEVAEISGVDNDSLDGLNTTSWGCFFFDHDNDGWDDLFVANGQISAADFIANVEQDPDKLFRNMGDGTFEDITDASHLGSIQQGRGTAYGDFNNDGLLDIVVNNVSHYQQGATALLYLNATNNANNWLKVNVNGAQSNRDGYGSTVKIFYEEVVQTAEVSGGSSHASQNSSVVHFGIGSATNIDSILVIFPSGVVRAILNPAPNQTITVFEDDIITSNPTSPFYNPQVKQTGIRSFELSGALADNLKIQLFDPIGRTVFSSSLTSSRFDLPETHTGVFMLSIKSKEYSTSLKVLLTN
jgi:hypothetical protein